MNNFWRDVRADLVPEMVKTVLACAAGILIGWIIRDFFSACTLAKGSWILTHLVGRSYWDVNHFANWNRTILVQKV